MTATVLVAVPVLRRPHRVEQLVASVDKATTVPFSLLFITDPDDHDERAAVKAAGADLLDVAGSYATKINAALKASTEPYLFTGADDLCFHDGWAEAAIRKMSRRVGVVGTNDLGNPRVKRGRHATHSLVARDYAENRGTVDQVGKIFHDGYGHNFCDEELVATARRRRAFAFAVESRVEHLHPNWHADVPRDDVYEKGQSTWAQDQALFTQRARLWR